MKQGVFAEQVQNTISILELAATAEADSTRYEILGEAINRCLALQKQCVSRMDSDED